MKPNQKQSAKQQRIITATVIAVVLLAVLVVVLDWKDVRQIADRADWRFTLVALAFTAASYICLTLSYAVLNRFFGIRVRWRDLYYIGFTTSTLNNILAFMGAAGHSLRLVMIGNRGKPGEVLAASIFHSYLNNITMLALLPLSLLWLVAVRHVSGAGAISLGLISVLLIFLFLIATAILFLSPLRSWVLNIVNKIWHFITRRDINTTLTELDNALNKGFTVVKGRRLALVLLFFAGDWGFAAAALYFCFRALGYAPGWGVTLSGFGFGISAGNLSFIPGGLGVQEASMAGIFALLGTPFAGAVLAAILFRVVFDFIPFFISLVFYRQLLRGHVQPHPNSGNEKTNKP